MEKIRQMMDTLRKDPRMREMIQGMKQPENAAEAAAAYAKLAKEAGFDISAEEIAEAMKKMEQAQLARSGEAAEKVEKAALTEDDLDQVAGGADGCESTYTPGEWCWFSDSCSAVVNTGYITQAGEVFVGGMSEEDNWAVPAGNYSQNATDDTIHNILYEEEWHETPHDFLYGDTQ